MAEAFLYLTTIGRVSGRARQIEIWFVERDERFYVVAEAREDAGWVKNLTKEPRIVFSVGTRSARESVVPATYAVARIVRDEGDLELAKTVKALMDAKYGWSDGLLVELTKTNA
jgi:hypothetical protein